MRSIVARVSPSGLIADAVRRSETGIVRSSRRLGLHASGTHLRGPVSTAACFGLFRGGARASHDALASAARIR